MPTLPERGTAVLQTKISGQPCQRKNCFTPAVLSRRKALWATNLRKSYKLGRDRVGCHHEGAQRPRDLLSPLYFAAASFHMPFSMSDAYTLPFEYCTPQM